MKFRRMVLLLLSALLLTGCTPLSADPVPANSYAPEDFAVVDGFLTYQGDSPSHVGVDVSSYQGEIDWAKVREAGVEFAIIRVGFRGYTEGGLYEDSCFRQNMEEALAAGLKVGAYFFSQAVTAQEAREEARYAMELLEGYELTYPVVYDWERQGAEDSRTRDTDGQTQTECAVAFCQEVEARGYQPMVYFSPSKAYSELDLEALLDWPFWLAHYTQDWEATTFRYHFAMWQYTSQGTVDGIPTPVDLDLCMMEFPVQTPEEEGPHA